MAKESHSSGLGKGELGLWSCSASFRTGEDFPSSPKEVCKNMGSSSQGQPGEDRDQAKGALTRA